MSDNYNIKRDVPLLSSEQIDKHRDFDALLRRYHSERPRPARPPRRLYWISALAAAAAIGLLWYFNFTRPAPAAISEEDYFAAQPFVAPPLPAIQPEYQVKKVNAGAGGEIALGEGSRLVVPATAFLDDRGRLVEGDVDIHYREMHDYIDFFLAGIPMVYDSAGQRYYLESAGMIEIFALREGRRVTLAPDKAIEVFLASEITIPKSGAEAPRYHIYKLDTAQRRWVYQNVEHTQWIEDQAPLDPDDPRFDAYTRLQNELEQIESRAAARLAAMEADLPLPKAPLKPQRKSSGIALSLDVANSAERDFYEGTVWEISPRSPEYDERAFRINWDDMRLRPLNELEYELTLIKEDKELTLVVIPVLSDEAFQRAQEKYRAALAAYEEQSAQRQARLAEREAALREATEREKAAARQRHEAEFTETTQADEPAGAYTRRRIVSRFLATSLGVWNCDRPIPLSGETLAARFVDQEGKVYSNHTAYLANRRHNTVFRFHAGQNAALRFDQHTDNILWIVGEDGRIAVLSPEAFRQSTRRKGKQEFQLRRVDQQIDSQSTLRALLSFNDQGQRGF
jgi:hypothetical protein